MKTSGVFQRARSCKRSGVFGLQMPLFPWKIACVLCLIGYHSLAFSQDDPFAGGDVDRRVPRPVQPTLTSGEVLDGQLQFTDPTRRVVIQAVLNSNPQSAEQLVAAISTLLEVDADIEAKSFINRLAALVTDDAQMFALHRAAGSPFFIDLASRDDLQPEGKSFADQVLDAAWRFAYDPSRLDSLTRDLNHENIYVRSDALAQLKIAGESGAAAILNALADKSRSEQFPHLRTALNNFGNDATEPLLGAIFSDHVELRMEAAQALGNVASDRAEWALYHALATGQTTQLRSLARHALTRQLGGPPSLADVERNLYFAAFNNGRSLPVDPFEPEVFSTFWKWQGKLVPQRIRNDLRRQLLAAPLAEALLFMRPEEAEYRGLYLVSALQAMKSEKGIDRPLDEGFADSLLRRFTSVDLNQALDNAISRRLAGAACGACELLERCGDPSVLSAQNGQPSSLARALQFGDQRVTYAACRAISALGVDRPFAGTSYYLRSLVYLARAQGHRNVLIAHRDPAVVRNLADAALTSGYVPVTATNARQVFQLATTNPDIELIVLSDTISQPDYLELVQMLRRDPRSKQIPIGLSYLEWDAPRIQSYCNEDPLAVPLPITVETGVVARQLYNLSLRRGLDRLEPITRIEFAQWANSQLATLTETESITAVFDFAEYQEQLAENLHSQIAGAAATKVLGRIGTPFAQRQLLSIVNQSNMALEAREAALAALSYAVRKNGILLTKQEILWQYDYYNNSANEPDESRQIYATVLDLIENK
ncbi:MAG TPA: hypothetical protein PKA83_06030 [Pirellulaceae bacterium]|nr:hypothetical protein [Pirellulaceae bacterium]